MNIFDLFYIVIGLAGTLVIAFWIVTVTSYLIRRHYETKGE